MAESEWRWAVTILVTGTAVRGSCTRPVAVPAWADALKLPHGGRWFEVPKLPDVSAGEK